MSSVNKGKRNVKLKSNRKINSIKLRTFFNINNEVFLLLGTLKQTMHFDRFPGHVRIYLLQYYTTQHALISKRKKNLGPQIGGSP